MHKNAELKLSKGVHVVLPLPAYGCRTAPEACTSGPSQRIDAEGSGKEVVTAKAPLYQPFLSCNTRQPGTGTAISSSGLAAVCR